MVNGLIYTYWIIWALFLAAIFVGVWIACVAWGGFWGFVLGWLPARFLSAVLAPFWPVFVITAGVLLLP